MEISELNIETLLPQRRPFIMVDRLLYFDPIITRTEFKALYNNLFVKNGVLVESGIVENIAQTCAARIGYMNSVLHSEEVRVGFIGSIKNLNIYRLPKINETLITEIKVINEVMNITLVSANILINSDIVADCEMKIALQ